jgi:hypothetical protein
MSPGYWAMLILGVVAGCGLTAFLAEVADGTPEERRAYEAKRAREDAEAMLRGEL